MLFFATSLLACALVVWALEDDKQEKKENVKVQKIGGKDDDEDEDEDEEEKEEEEKEEDEDEEDEDETLMKKRMKTQINEYPITFIDNLKYSVKSSMIVVPVGVLCILGRALISIL